MRWHSLLIPLLFLFSLLSANAQLMERTIDSLQNHITTSRPRKIEALLELARLHNTIDQTSNSLLYCRQAAALSKLTCDSLHLVQAYRMMAASHRRSQQTDSAIYYARASIAIAARNGFASEKEFILKYLANIYTHRNQYGFALDCYFQSLVMAEAKGNINESLLLLSSIGEAYYQLQQFDKSGFYFSKALTGIDQHHPSYLSVINSLGSAETKLGSLPDAINHFTIVLDACKQIECTTEVVINSEYGLAQVYFLKRDYKASLKYLNSAYARAVSLGRTLKQAECLTLFGRIDLFLNNTVRAEQRLRMAEQIANANSYLLLQQEILQQLEEVYMNLGDSRLANYYHLSYQEHRDKIFREQLSNIDFSLNRQLSADEMKQQALASESQQALLILESIKTKDYFYFLLTVCIAVFMLTALMVAQQYTIRRIALKRQLA